MQQIKTATAITAAVLCMPLDAAAVTLKEAVARASSNYAAIRASLSEVAARESGVDLAKTAYLPKTDFYFRLVSRICG
jgi:outer membrane protein TolC